MVVLRATHINKDLDSGRIFDEVKLQPLALTKGQGVVVIVALKS